MISYSVISVFVVYIYYFLHTHIRTYLSPIKIIYFFILTWYSSVITWLNKQLNENQLPRKQETLGMFETPAAGLRTGSVPHNMVMSRCHLKSSIKSAKQLVVCRCSRKSSSNCLIGLVFWNVDVLVFSRLIAKVSPCLWDRLSPSPLQ